MERTVHQRYEHLYVSPNYTTFYWRCKLLTWWLTPWMMLSSQTGALACERTKVSGHQTTSKRITVQCVLGWLWLRRDHSHLHYVFKPQLLTNVYLFIDIYEWEIYARLRVFFYKNEEIQVVFRKISFISSSKAAVTFSLQTTDEHRMTKQHMWIFVHHRCSIVSSSQSLFMFLCPSTRIITLTHRPSYTYTLHPPPSWFQGLLTAPDRLHALLLCSLFLLSRLQTAAPAGTLPPGRCPPVSGGRCAGWRVGGRGGSWRRWGRSRPRSCRLPSGCGRRRWWRSCRSRCRSPNGHRLRVESLYFWWICLVLRQIDLPHFMLYAFPPKKGL